MLGPGVLGLRSSKAAGYNPWSKNNIDLFHGSPMSRHSFMVVKDIHFKSKQNYCEKATHELWNKVSETQNAVDS